MKTPRGGLFASYCDENGNLKPDLLDAAFERAKKQRQMDQLEIEFGRLYNAEDFGAIN